MSKKPRLQVPCSGPTWREGRNARRDRREAAQRALGDLEMRARTGRAWNFQKFDGFLYKDAS